VSEEHERDRAGVQSVEVAGEVLRALADLGGRASLAEIAKRCGIHPSKVHRYVVSLVRASLMEQDAERGRYAAGPLAMTLGLMRLRSLDFVAAAMPQLAALRDATDETTLLAMWSDQGPVVLKLEESSRPVFLNVRVGSTLPLGSTATGRIFTAFLPPEQVRPLLAREFRDGRELDAYLRDLDQVRAAGLAWVEGGLVPGVNALAAPVFDINGRMTAAVGLLGRDVDLDVSPSGEPARALAEAAARISRDLGHLPSA
jgi:DNA-binding IclR family transcriptional regulator